MCMNGLSPVKIISQRGLAFSPFDTVKIWQYHFPENHTMKT